MNLIVDSEPASAPPPPESASSVSESPHGSPVEVPRHIYQTWHTKDLPPKMRECVDSLRADNPELEHHLFDDADCRAFIQSEFGGNVLRAYDSLVPGAYKADLWRYCVLYKRGGVYLDIKYRCIDGFKIAAMLGEEHFTKDRYDANYNLRVYNAFMVCLPQNEIMRRCIVQVVENVRTQYYGNSALYPTGPSMMPQFFSPAQILLLDELSRHSDDERVLFIRYKNKNILSNYPEYRSDQAGSQVTEHYTVMWAKKNIYGPPFRTVSMAKFRFN